MERETIIQLLRIYTTLPESTREKLADAILNHQKINMPTEEEIQNEFPLEEDNMMIPMAKRVGAFWFKSEIEKRNKS